MRHQALLKRFAAVALAAAFAHAQAASPADVPVPFVSGGVGDTDLARITAMERDYRLKLVFTAMEGNYLADIGVKVTDGKGQPVITAVSEGPIFLARLPAGSYNVVATHEGTTLTRKISVPASGLRTEYLRWPSDPSTNPPSPRK